MNQTPTFVGFVDDVIPTDVEDTYPYSTKMGGAPNKKHSYVDDPSEDGEWASETYEYVKDRLFSKFIKRLSHAPGQCLRYSFGGQPLVMSHDGKSKVESLPKCIKCGNVKVFEFQILSTIIAQVNHTKPKNGELDFGNAFIYTCAKHCFDKVANIHNDVIYIEDSILIERSV
eukprot:gene1506-1753_t